MYLKVLLNQVTTVHVNLMSNFLCNPISPSNLVSCAYEKVLVCAVYLLLYPVFRCFSALLHGSLWLFSSSRSCYLYSISISLCMSVLPASSVPCTLLQHLWHLSLLHYFCLSLLCCISLPPVYSPSRLLSTSFSLSFPDIDLHSSHTAEPPVALQWAHFSLLLLCVLCVCARKQMCMQENAAPDSHMS